jgi:hypothetical protein
LHRFVIRDPKSRVIHAPAFRDRVVHHAICSVLEPIFDKTFIHDSYASRKGKGTHAALERFDAFQRKLTANGTLVPHAKDSNILEERSPRKVEAFRDIGKLMLSEDFSGSRRCYASSQMVRGWAFKADIRHYFPSVDHGILLKLLERKISDRRVLSLLRLILESYAPRPGIGMPLGALTSQLFANVYLNPLDHFVKEELNSRFYLRYLDDFVILDRSQENIKGIKSEISGFLSEKLKLNMHPEKSSIFPLHRGVGLLGFRAFYHYRLLRKSNVLHFYRRLAEQEQAYRTGALSKEVFEKSIAGWIAHASWGNTYKLRMRVADRSGTF